MIARSGLESLLSSSPSCTEFVSFPALSPPREPIGILESPAISLRDRDDRLGVAKGTGERWWLRL